MAQIRKPGTLGAQIPPTRPEDGESVLAVVAALYNVISGEKGVQRDWDRLRSLFIPGARLVPPHRGLSEPAQVMDVETYIVHADEWFRTTSFFESQIAARVESFGNVAHVFSTYVSKHAADDPEPFMRGINSIQLLQEDGLWRVVTILWDVEQEDNPIPVQYLPEP